jgi:2-polyprenyl-3-methyl-5-hydroxy-6-metoxy-1,4-benzoquinol methylase
VIERWSAGCADQNMAEDILLELGPIVRQHPWWRARARLTLRILKDLHFSPPARILDAGCGWGVTLLALENAGFRADGLDQSRRALELIDRPNRLLIEADLNQPLPESPPEYDAVLALDVIEHLDRDDLALNQLARLVRPGGALIVSVPALPSLFGEFDDIQGHRRRYLPDYLSAAMGGSSLEIDRIFWWGRWLLPLVRRARSAPKGRPGEPASAVYRRHLKVGPAVLSWAASLAFRLEESPALKGRLKVGTSLVAIGRKPLPRANDDLTAAR